MGQSREAARLVLAKQVRLLRFLNGWSQEDLADAAGLHRTSISMIERGRSNVRLDKVERLAEGLKVPLAALFQGQPRPGACDCGEC